MKDNNQPAPSMLHPPPP